MELCPMYIHTRMQVFAHTPVAIEQFNRAEEASEILSCYQFYQSRQAKRKML